MLKNLYIFINIYYDHTSDFAPGLLFISTYDFIIHIVKF